MAFDFDNCPQDRALYQGILTEAIEIFGISIQYWRADRDPEKDLLYTEDAYPNISKKFDMKAYPGSDGVLMKEIYNFGKFGFQSPDQTDLYITRTQFESAYGEYATPRAGDFILIKYMGEDITVEDGTNHGRVFYISSVEQEDHIFLQHKHTYRIHLVHADSEGASVNPEISGSDDPNDQLFDPNMLNVAPSGNDDSLANTPEITGILRNKTNDPNPWGEW